jgi:hypothetical protein
VSGKINIFSVRKILMVNYFIVDKHCSMFVVLALFYAFVKAENNFLNV